MVVDNIYKMCSLEVQEAIFWADLMELLFDEFDLILGMDWLVEHQVKSKCATKRVTLKTSDGKHIVMVGERRDYLPNVIFVMVVEKFV